MRLINWWNKIFGKKQITNTNKPQELSVQRKKTRRRKRKKSSKSSDEIYVDVDDEDDLLIDQARTAFAEFLAEFPAATHKEVAEWIRETGFENYTVELVTLMSSDDTPVTTRTKETSPTIEISTSAFEVDSSSHRTAPTFSSDTSDYVSHDSHSYGSSDYSSSSPSSVGSSLSDNDSSGDSAD